MVNRLIHSGAMSSVLLPFIRRLKILHIDTMELVPFPVNWAQIEMLDAIETQFRERGRARVIVLKARQLGISTLTQGLKFTFATTFENYRGLTLAHEEDGSKHLLSMSHTFWEHYAFRDLLSQQTGSESALAWHNGSSMRISTARSKGASRGRTFSFLHGSEVGFWPDATGTMTGVRQAIPNVDFSVIVLESTANGIGNWFHKTWEASEAGDTEYRPLFFPWYRHPRYKGSAIGLEYKSLGALSPEERALRVLGVDDDSMSWRRWAVRNLTENNEELFMQEYPATPEEAFLSTGTNVFPLPKLQAIYRPRAGITGRLLRDGQRVRFIEDRSGPLTMFGKPAKDKDWGKYVLGADATHTCYSDDTEVLTRRGWQLFQDTTPEDWFATRSPEGAFEWQRSSKLVNVEYRGPMYHFHTQSLDLLVTPNHRMLIETQKHPERPTYFMRADQLAAEPYSSRRLPRRSTWQGTPIDRFHLSKTAGNRSNPIDWSGDDYCEFMGLWLSEGSLGGKGRVFISQLPGGRATPAIKELLDRIGVAYNYNGINFEMTNLALHRHLQQFGKAREKFIPQDIMDATPEQIGRFVDAFWLGDGAWQYKFRVFITSSKHLADQLQELAQKIGLWASVGVKPGGFRSILGREPRHYLDQYSVRFTHTRNAGYNITKIDDWSGRVVCVAVPHGSLYVRRNGRAIWCGNTFGDWAVGQVLNRRSLEQVAVYRDRVDPGTFAEEMFKLGLFYNTALLAPEKEGPGQQVIGRLLGMNYPNVFQHAKIDRTPGKVITDRWGWSTTAQTKQYAIGELLKLVVDGINPIADLGLTLHDERTFGEMKNFVTLPDGGFGNANGEDHDDHVMAIAIAVACHKLDAPTGLVPLGENDEPYWLPDDRQPDPAPPWESWEELPSANL